MWRYILKLLVLDGNSILNRAFYGIKILTTQSGQFTNAIYGFLTTLKKVEDELNPELTAITFDLREPTFRHKLSDAYKANRKGMPDELAQQMPVLKELLKYLGYKIITYAGFEADDIIGTLAKKCDEQGYECVIATGDRDSLQLVSKNVTVRLVSTKFGKSTSVIFDEAKVFEDYGVKPKQLIEIKALQGDSSDNIPGVKGIGEKTAKMLIQQFGDIDKIYNDIENIEIKQNLKDKLIKGKDSAYLSKTLGTIVTNVPIESDIKSFVRGKVDVDNSLKLLKELEFFSLIKKLGLEEKNSDSKSTFEGIEINVCPDLNLLKDEVVKCSEFYFYIDYSDKEKQCVGICFNKKVFLIDSLQKDFDEFLKFIFESNQIKKVVYDLKNLISYLSSKNIKIEGDKKDILLCAYLINPSLSDYSLENLCKQYCVEYFSFNKEGFSEIQESLVSCVTHMESLIKFQVAQLEKNNQISLLNDIEQPLSEVLSSMERCGFGIDFEGISEYGKLLGKQIDEIKSKIYTLCGIEFNINSPKQLGKILFEDLGLPKGKKGKSGYSTGADILESLVNYHPVISLILEYRALSKLKSTYCDGLLKLVSKDNRIHSNFNQTETRTGRISSTEPNLQNIPIRTEAGRQLRKYFCAKENCVLIDADYSQIELRVLAHISNDAVMIDTFNNDKDIHTITASQIFNVPLQMVTSAMRTRAKAVNFGIVYGIGAFSLSKDLGISIADADKYIKAYLHHYSGVDKYMKDIVEFAKDKGYVETLFNRRRYLPEITASNFNLRLFGERVARNMPIQGTAADIIKIAMIRVYNRIKELNLKSRLILQVHDELIVEADIVEADIIEEILKSEMQNAVKLSVPMEIHISKGKTWYDAKD